MTSFDTTPAVQRAFEVARRWAMQQRQRKINSFHLLQGLLHEEEGRPWAILVEAGLDPTLVRQSLATEMVDVVDEELVLSPSLGGVMSRALDLARNFGEELSIATEHLLVALVETDDQLRQMLEEKGLQYARIKAKVDTGEKDPIQLSEPLRLDNVIENSHTARIIDASANRAREALRVLEDYCRFVLNDAILCGTMKQLRHDLADALATVPALWLMQARDTQGDVGTAVSTDSELDRGNLSNVVQAANKRLQEALRSLEEYGKLVSGELAGKVEALRYRAYTVEAALLGALNTPSRLEAAELCVLVGSQACQGPLADIVRGAIAGGAKMIQLRDKMLDDRALLKNARQLREICRDSGVLFIVNDRPDVARLAQADGVHLGQGDLLVADARRIVGADALIGVSTHNLEQLGQAVLDGASYVGIGPVYSSGTKSVDPNLAGLKFVRQASETTLPAFAIGGITANNVASAAAAGARRVAVAAAVCQADDPAEAAAAILRELRNAKTSPEGHGLVG